MFNKILLAAMLTAALSAGAISVRQLRTASATPTACGSPCTRSTICARPCFCYFGLSDGTTGICQPEGPAPAPTK
jgi:hypothetical protein